MRESTATVRAESSLMGRLFVLGFAVLTILAFMYFDLTHYLSLDAIKPHRDSLRQLAEPHYAHYQIWPGRQ